MTHEAKRSTAALRDLAALLEDVADTYESAPELTAVEGHRNVMHLLSCATEYLLEADEERPTFSRIVSPTRKILGDNPDAIYHWTRIRGDRRYRIVGRRGNEVYASYTIHARDAGGGALERVVADVNDRTLEADRDGRYEIVLSADKQPGNWIELDPDATTIITRHYFAQDRPAAANPDNAVNITIEPIDDPGPPKRINDASFAERLGEVTAWVRAESIGRPAPTSVPSFVSIVPNEMPTPANFRSSGVEAWGAVDIYYASAKFLLQPHEALVLEGRLPPCAFANVMLWNSYMQTLEYRFRQTTLNHRQIRTDDDGTFRIVVAHQDPGVPNWLDTEGRESGTIFWRYLLPETEPERVVSRVVPIESVAGSDG